MQNRTNSFAARTQKTLLPLVAVGGSLAAAPAYAIELGEVSVQSGLGQPLRASIAVAVAPHEQISEHCVSLGSAAGASGLPGIGRATLSVANGVILLTGEAAIREPMVATNVVVDCPYTPNISREYMMFIDPVSPAFEVQPEVQTAPVAAADPTPVRQAPATRATSTRRSVNREPIGTSTRVRVERGDTLGDIAKRIENRPIGLWAAADEIFAANPAAFMNNDPNRLKAGSWLTIPSFDGSVPVVSAADPVVEPAAQSTPVSATGTSVYDAEVAAAALDANNQAATSTESAAAPIEAPAATVAAPAAIDAAEALEPAVDATTDLRPGDIILDTEIAPPVTESASPNVTTAVINTSTEKPASSWLLWLAGSGLAIIVALLLFGRRLRSFFGAAPASPAVEQPMRRATDVETEQMEAITVEEYDLDDDSPTAENLALDADLFMGTGLEEGTDMEVANDFGFDSPTEVDIELPFEPEAEVPAGETDILAPVRTDEHSILDSEVLPEDDDYDMSVMIDATKMPRPEDITERDLKAVEIEAVADLDPTDSYTIDREVDLEILERDYEDELTATQKLNEEIARAAIELAEHMDDESEDVTSEMPLATVTELDVTAQLPARDEEISDLDDTGVNEAVTVNISADDKTAEMPSAGNDETVEMEVEGGKVDTKTG